MSRIDYRATICNENIANIFEDMFHQFCEISQDEFTWTRNNSFSRIDRLYTNLRTSDLLDNKPQAKVAWNWSSKFGSTSDHLPVCCRFPSVRDSNRLAILPKWVVRSIDYTKCCTSIMERSGGVSSCPLQTHSEAKETIRLATSMVIKDSYIKPPQSIQQVIYITIKAYRLARRGTHLKVRHIADFYKPVRDTCLDGHYDCEKWHEYLSDITNKRGEIHIEEMHQEHKHAARNSGGLYKWMQLWAIKGRRFSATGIVFSSDESVANLISHWQPIFCQNSGDQKLAYKFASFFNYQPLRGTWTLSFEEFVGIMSMRKSSAPGPDGIAHSFLFLGPLHVHRVLYNLHCFALHLGTLPCNFNNAYSVFIPKSDLPSDNPLNAERKAKDMRPLSLAKCWHALWPPP
jgi:hypothetical protein